MWKEKKKFVQKRAFQKNLHRRRQNLMKQHKNKQSVLDTVDERMLYFPKHALPFCILAVQ